MSDTVTVNVPYESLDPLSIGSCEDPSMVYRDEIEVEIPRKNLWQWIQPTEPPAITDVTAKVAEVLENPFDSQTFSQAIGPDKTLSIIIDNQFRPTPACKILPAIFDAIEKHGIKSAHVICANGRIFPMSENDTQQKIGIDNLARMEKLGIPFIQNDPEVSEKYVFKGVTSRGTPMWLHKEVDAADVSISIGQAQSNHWGYGGGGKLILPGVASVESIETNHANFVLSPDTHYGAMAGPMRSDIDEAASLCDLTFTLNSVLDSKGAVCYMNFGSHPFAHREAIKKFNEIYAYERPEGGPADIAICGVFAPTDHLFFHTGWGCMSADLILKDHGDMIYCSPSPGVKTHLGDFPGMALMDLMIPYMPPNSENMERLHRDIYTRKVEMWSGCIWVPVYEVMARKQLSIITLEENLGMAKEIGIYASTDLQAALDSALEKHGPDAKVIVLPYARYQMPTDAIRMPG